MPYYAPREGGERVFGIAPVPLKFGAGALGEVGDDAAGMGVTRAAVFTDRNVARTEPFADALASLKAAGVEAAVYDTVEVEPTDRSFKDAIAFAREAGCDGFVSIGGGSVMDTAKAANLYVSHPADFLDYVAAPFGRLKPVPGPLLPHIACPTTCGTGSETTGVAVFDFVEEKVKTVIHSQRLRPNLAVVDPRTTYSLPGGVVASTGFDVLTHAIESYTARPFTARERPKPPRTRPPHQGANPWSDIGALEAIRIGGTFIERAVNDAEDFEARDNLMFAAALAGIAFGNAGVHLPHAMSYAVAGTRHDFRAKGYEGDKPMVPHGISVVVNAPACFRFTAPAAPERHLRAAEALGADVTGAGPEDAGTLLADRLIALMRATGIPNGVGGVGYSEADLPELVKGAAAQPRLLVNAPRQTGEAELAELFRDAMRYW